jgi:hypothetical protein
MVSTRGLGRKTFDWASRSSTTPWVTSEASTRVASSSTWGTSTIRIATAARRIKGRVLDASSVRGKLIAHEAAGSCPGDYEVGFYAELIDDRGGGSDGGFRPRDGRYAGAGDGSYMWFDVEDGGAVNGQVAVARGPCDSFNLPAGGSDPVGDDHRFRLEQTTTLTDVTLKGKFVAEGRVTGKAIVDTTHPACAGTYEFKYTAERFRDPG